MKHTHQWLKQQIEKKAVFPTMEEGQLVKLDDVLGLLGEQEKELRYDLTFMQDNPHVQATRGSYIHLLKQLVGDS